MRDQKSCLFIQPFVFIFYLPLLMLNFDLQEDRGLQARALYDYQASEYDQYWKA